MIVSYPIVNDRGVLSGGEVTCRFMDIRAIEHMSAWVRRPATLDAVLDNNGEFGERYELVPGCITIHLLRNEFNVQADYATLKQQMIDLGEWNEAL